MVRKLSTPSGLKPGSTCCTRHIALTSSPAPTSRTTVATISAITSADRRRFIRPPTVDRERSAFRSASRNERTAGPTPNARLVATASAAANPNTRQSISGVALIGRADGTRIANAGVATAARARPIPPPTNARKRLSVNSCRTSRSRAAPMATRTAISCRRTMARANREVRQVRARDEQHAKCATEHPEHQQA